VTALPEEQLPVFKSSCSRPNQRPVYVSLRLLLRERIKLGKHLMALPLRVLPGLAEVQACCLVKLRHSQCLAAMSSTVELWNQ